jgi:hypothetical protein
MRLMQFSKQPTIQAPRQRMRPVGAHGARWRHTRFGLDRALRVTGMPQNSNFWDARLLLRTRRKRPRCHRAAKKCNELAPLHGPPENKS